MSVFREALWVMLWGMIGIFTVLLVIYFIIKMLMKLFPQNED